VYDIHTKDRLFKKTYKIIVGFEYPQSSIDNPELVDEILIQNGRYSPFHREMLEKIKSENTEVFGFDLEANQFENIENKSIDWRDKIMAENINKYVEKLKEDEKILIITGDVHFQTRSNMIGRSDENGEMKPVEYLPMCAQLKLDSILVIPLRYLSGQFYNFKLREISEINSNKGNYFFRDTDDVVEVIIQKATPTINPNFTS
jgi:hypothetical protein